jgi:hypothetical protein
MTAPKTESIMNFNQIIGSPGTSETGMGYYNFQILSIFKNGKYYYHRSVRKFTKYFLDKSSKNKIFSAKR